MENRIDTTSDPANKGIRGGFKFQQADPNELLIQLVASGIRANWSEHERRNRAGMGCYQQVHLKTLSADLSRLVSVN